VILNIPDDCLSVDIPIQEMMVIKTYIPVPSQNQPVCIRLVYDTGASGLSLSQSFFDMYGFEPIGTDKVQTADGLKDVNQYEVKDFWLHGQDFGNVIANSCKIYGLDEWEKDGLEGPYHPWYIGLVGLRYIKGFDTYFSFEQHKKAFFIPRNGYIEGVRNSKEDRKRLAQDVAHFYTRGQVFFDESFPLKQSN
jgi:hypothetical protein